MGKWVCLGAVRSVWYVDPILVRISTTVQMLRPSPVGHLSQVLVEPIRWDPPRPAPAACVSGGLQGLGVTVPGGRAAAVLVQRSVTKIS